MEHQEHHENLRIQFQNHLKIMKTLEFHSKIMKIIQILEFQLRITKNNENIKVTIKTNENHENLKIHKENKGKS